MTTDPLLEIEEVVDEEADPGVGSDRSNVSASTAM
jgi:hypothetical protein